LAGGGVEHQPDLVRRARDDALARTAHFLEFGHQIFFGMKATSRVDDDVIDGTRFGGLKRIEHHGAWIGAGFLTD